MLYIDQSIIGKTFMPNSDPVVEYTGIGYADTGTLLIVGSQFDSTNNRSHVKTFKLTDVRFKGQITPASVATLPKPGFSPA